MLETKMSGQSPRPAMMFGLLLSAIFLSHIFLSISLLVFAFAWFHSLRSLILNPFVWSVPPN